MFHKHYLEITLDEIVKGCQAKKLTAQHLLYQKMSGLMYAVCLRYCSNQNDAQDVLQEGFINVFERIYQFEFKGSFEGWMKRIFINKALERYRQKKYLYIELDEDKEAVFFVSNNASDLLEAEDLMKIIDQLSPQYKTVFSLYAIEGYSHKEIGEMLGISESTSKSNLSRARSILQFKVKNIVSKHEKSLTERV